MYTDSDPEAYDFKPFEKIARLKKETVITEKLDGTNAQIMITSACPVGDIEAYVIASQFQEITDTDQPMSALYMMVGSRKRWIAPEGTIMHMEEPVKGTDNFGFAAWAKANSEELFKLGEGRHYGEWYGKGIQRGYGLEEKRFALFNTARWGAHNPSTPDCCEVVTIITGEEGEEVTPDEAMAMLDAYGSQHVWYDSTEELSVCDAAPMTITTRVRFDNPEGIVVYHSGSRTLYKQTFGNDGGKWTAPTQEAEFAVEAAMEEPIKQGMAEYGA